MSNQIRRGVKPKSQIEIPNPNKIPIIQNCKEPLDEGSGAWDLPPRVHLWLYAAVLN
jgi:hypothetical protein